MAIRQTYMQRVVQLTLNETEIRRAITEFCKTQDSELVPFSVDRLDFHDDFAAELTGCTIVFVHEIKE